MSATQHAFEILASPDSLRNQAFIVWFGDEMFLRSKILSALKRTLVEDADDATVFEGKTCDWRDVHDELTMVSLFGSGERTVIVREADDFVSQHRSQLEDLAKNSDHSGVLALELKTFPANTNLYKQAVKSGLVIDCRLPLLPRSKDKVDEKAVRKWFQTYAQQTHNVQLQGQALDAMFELVGLELGLLDQETAKLALFVSDKEPASVQLIEKVVGGWRQKTTWEMLEAATSGDAAEALVQLEHLLQSGEHPVGLFGPLSWYLRRFAAATRIIQAQEQETGKYNLDVALREAGFPHWDAAKFSLAKKQLGQLRRERAGQINRWLLEADLALKGTHSAPEKARFVLEELILKMSRQASPLARA